MGWSLAPALTVLRKQVNTLAPKRLKISDGTIGDTAHSARTSDHNPDAFGVVRAIDLTHDPANGADMLQISERLRTSRDPRIKYVIFYGRYFSPKTNWLWRPYTGPNAHLKHMHLSVTANDSTNPWPIGKPPPKEDTVILRPGAKGDHVKLWQTALNEAIKRNGLNVPPLVIDGDYGQAMTSAVTAYQTAAQIGFVPELGSLDDYTRDLLVEFTRADV